MYYNQNNDLDTRTRTKMNWHSVVLNAMEKLGGNATLKQLYSEIEGHAKLKQINIGEKNKANTTNI